MSSYSGLSVSILRSIHEVAGISEEWEELFNATDAGPCASYDWFANWVSHSELTEELLVGVVRDSEGVVGIIPLQLRSRSVLKIVPVKVAMVIGGGWPNECPILLAERTHRMPVVQAILARLRSDGEPWTFCHMTYVPRESRIVSGSEGNGEGTSGIKCQYEVLPGSIVIDLPHSMGEFRKTLSRSFRQLVSRRARGLAREGSVQVVRLGLDTAQSQKQMSRLIDDAIAVSQRSWQGASQEGRAISHPDTREFFTDVTLAMAARGMADLSVLYLNSKPISFLWGVTRKGRVSILKLGFDSRFHSLSPGTAHFAWLVEDSIGRGMTQIDWGPESSEHKKKWSKRERELRSVYYYPPGLRPSLIRWRHLCTLRRQRQAQGRSIS